MGKLKKMIGIGIVCILVITGLVMYAHATLMSVISSNEMYFNGVLFSYEKLKEYLEGKAASFDNQEVNDHFFQRMIALSKHRDLVEKMDKELERQVLFMDDNSLGIGFSDGAFNAYLNNSTYHINYMTETYKMRYALINHKFDYLKDLVQHFVLERGLTVDLARLKDSLIYNLQQFFLDKENIEVLKISPDQNLCLNEIFEVLKLLGEEDLSKQFIEKTKAEQFAR